MPALVYAGAARVRTRSLTASRDRVAALWPRPGRSRGTPAWQRKAECGRRIPEAEPEHAGGVDLRILERDLDGKAVHQRGEANGEIVRIHGLEFAARDTLKHDGADGLAPMLVELAPVLRDLGIPRRDGPQVEPEHPRRLIGIIEAAGGATQLQQANQLADCGRRSCHLGRGELVEASVRVRQRLREQALARAEVVDDECLADAGSLGDVGEARIGVTAAADDLHSGAENLLSPIQRHLRRPGHLILHESCGHAAWLAEATGCILHWVIY